jgi:hypothetical protein
MARVGLGSEVAQSCIRFLHRRTLPLRQYDPRSNAAIPRPAFASEDPLSRAPTRRAWTPERQESTRVNLQPKNGPSSPSGAGQLLSEGAAAAAAVSSN